MSESAIISLTTSWLLRPRRPNQIKFGLQLGDTLELEVKGPVDGGDHLAAFIQYFDESVVFPSGDIAPFGFGDTAEFSRVMTGHSVTVLYNKSRSYRTSPSSAQFEQGMSSGTVFEITTRQMIERGYGVRDPLVLTQSGETPPTAPSVKVDFEHAVKNGAWHIIQPVSMDYRRAESMQRKASQWVGTAVGLSGISDLGTMFFLMGQPSAGTSKGLRACEDSIESGAH